MEPNTCCDCAGEVSAEDESATTTLLPPPLPLAPFSRAAITLLHHRNPNSPTTVPPCANPHKWILSGLQRHSSTMRSMTVCRSSSAGVGSGLLKSSPRGSNDAYH